MHCPFSRIHECMHTSTRVRQAPMVSSKHAASVFYSPIFVFPLKSILYNYELNKQRIICSLMHFHTHLSSHRTRMLHRRQQTMLANSWTRKGGAILIPSHRKWIEIEKKTRKRERERARDVGRWYKLLRARVRVSSIRSNRTGDHECTARNSPENEMLNWISFREWLHCVSGAQQFDSRESDAEPSECFHEMCANTVNTKCDSTFPHGRLLYVELLFVCICIHTCDWHKGERTVQVHARRAYANRNANCGSTTRWCVLILCARSTQPWGNTREPRSPCPTAWV